MKEFEYLKSLLTSQYNQEYFNLIIDGFNKRRLTTFRINTLKSNEEEVLSVINSNNISYKRVNEIDNAYILIDKVKEDLDELDIYNDGKIYFQSLSSMLPPVLLEPKEKMDILDMCAAPGSKTCQIAAMTNNKARITACELNKIRAERLAYNISKQGASSVYVMNVDARNLDDFFRFDQILLDAPCSGSGTHTLFDKSPFKGFSKELVIKSTNAQEKLLKKAMKALKVGGELVYSTCSILQSENEDILKKCMNKNYEIVPIIFEDEKLIKLPTKIEGTLVVCPNEYYEGFFISKIKRIR